MHAMHVMYIFACNHDVIIQNTVLHVYYMSLQCGSFTDAGTPEVNTSCKNLAVLEPLRLA
jgi:hypothetical protein